MSFEAGNRVRIPHRPDLAGYVRIEVATPTRDGWQLFVEQGPGTFAKVALTAAEAAACDLIVEDGAGDSAVTRRRNCESVRTLVAHEISETRGKLSAKRLLAKAVAAGYAGWDRNFRRLVAQERGKYRQRQAIVRSRPAVWSPGEHLVIDWGVRNGAARVLRRPGLEPGPVRQVRPRRTRGDHDAAARRVLHRARWGPEAGSARQDGLTG